MISRRLAWLRLFQFTKSFLTQGQVAFERIIHHARITISVHGNVRLDCKNYNFGLRVSQSSRNVSATTSILAVASRR